MTIAAFIIGWIFGGIVGMVTTAICSISDKDKIDYKDKDNEE